MFLRFNNDPRADLKPTINPYSNQFMISCLWALLNLLGMVGGCNDRHERPQTIHVSGQTTALRTANDLEHLINENDGE